MQVIDIQKRSPRRVECRQDVDGDRLLCEGDAVDQVIEPEGRASSRTVDLQVVPEQQHTLRALAWRPDFPVVVVHDLDKARSSPRNAAATARRGGGGMSCSPSASAPSSRSATAAYASSPLRLDRITREDTETALFRCHDARAPERRLTDSRLALKQ